MKRSTAGIGDLRLPRGGGVGVRAMVYALFFLSGATALIFEILWMRQFVTVFGNSSYAISVVLAAFMAGLGLGSLWFGRVADRTEDRLYIFALIEGGIILWALLVPALLAVLETVTPSIFASVSNFAAVSAIRFVFSFLVLLVPCFLMGGTLPLLSRFCVEARDAVGTRVSLLYGLNTLGATAGCFITGFWFIENLGQSGTNRVAIVVNLVILAAVLVVRAAHGGGESAVAASAEAETPQMPDAAGAAEEVSAFSAKLLVLAAFVSGFATMCAEVLWIRYLVFVVPNNQYSFTGILGVLLLGLALGSIIYRALLARRTRQILYLAGIEIILGPAILFSLVTGARAVMSPQMQERLMNAFGPAVGLGMKGGAVGLAAATIFLPAVLIGIVFPLVCAAYTRSVSTVGRSVGRIYAVSTLGSILGSLAPIAFVVPWLGIQNGIFAVAVSNSALGVLLVLGAGRTSARWVRGAAAAVGMAFLFVLAAREMPENLTQAIFLSAPDHNGGHNEVTLYKEGRTATVMVVRDTIIDRKEVYIGAVEEVPTTYMGHLFFKLFGSLGPLLQNDPADVLVLCLGGGVTAGTVLENPAVDKAVCVDLVAEMLDACRELSDVNNNVAENPKFEMVVEDARNYLAMNPAKWPVIICDSTHPKSPDSWALYTSEFYQAVKARMAADGVFLQWAPMHGISFDEYKILVNTFRSVFPHTSLWAIAGFDEVGNKWDTSVMMATAEPLTIDVARLAQRLAAESVKQDLAPWDLDTPAGLLSTFLCGEKGVEALTKGMPKNTDDLPVTQYNTAYTTSRECSASSLADSLASPWPYLVNTGAEKEARKLQVALSRSIAARKLLFEGRVLQAAAALPERPRLQTIRENLRRGAEYLKQAAGRYETDAAMLSQLAFKMQVLVSHNELARNEDYQAIIDIYQKAVAANPSNDRALVNLGSAFLAMGNMQEAADHFNRAIRTNPKNAEAHQNLGAMFAQIGKLDEAVRHMKRAARLAPENAQILTGLGTVLTFQGNIDAAIDNLRKAVDLEDENAEYLNNLGAALAQKARNEDSTAPLEEAIALFTRAAQIEPEDVRTHFSRGLAMAQKGHAAEALSAFAKVLLIDPNNSDAHTQIGAVLAGEGRFEEAAVSFRKALSIRPADFQASERLARLLAEERKFAQAVGTLRDGLKAVQDSGLSPTATGVNFLAWLLATSPDPAVRNGAEAVALAENVNAATGFAEINVLDTLAAAYAEAGQFEKAVTTAENAAQLARIQENADLAAQINARLELYKSGKPYHQPPVAQ